MKQKNVNYKYLNILLILLIIYVLFLLSDLWLGIFFKILDVLKPFLIAFAIAYAVYPIEQWLESKKIPKAFAITIIVFVLLLIFGIIIYSLIPIFTEQLFTFFSNIIKFVGDIGNKFSIDTLPIKNSLVDTLNNLTKNMGNLIGDGAISILLNSFTFITTSVIVIVCFIYFTSYMQQIRDTISLFLYKKRKKSYKLVKEIDHETTQYFKGVCLSILIQFIEYTTLFWLIGHPNFLLLGTMMAVFSLVPYFGGFIVNGIALIVASVVSTKLVILTLIIAIIFPQVDGYFINPRIYGKTNNISPLLTIFAVFTGGVLGGVEGILIALPITIILRTLYRHYKEDIKVKIEDIKDRRN